MRYTVKIPYIEFGESKTDNFKLIKKYTKFKFNNMYDTLEYVLDTEDTKFSKMPFCNLFNFKLKRVKNELDLIDFHFSYSYFTLTCMHNTGYEIINRLHLKDKLIEKCDWSVYVKPERENCEWIYRINNWQINGVLSYIGEQISSIEISFPVLKNEK